MLTIEKKSLRVGKYVDSKHVDTVLRNYKQERWVHNSERIGKEDSLSAWYSVEELEEFIEQVKLHGGDGIKFYFAAYPTDYSEKPEYAGRQTIVLVATRKSKDDKAGLENKNLYINTDKGSTILAYNTGQLCPPYCGKTTGDGDDWGGIGTTLIDRGDKGMVIV